MELTGTDCLQIWPVVERIDIEAVPLPDGYTVSKTNTKSFVDVNSLVEQIARVLPDVPSCYLVPDLINDQKAFLWGFCRNPPAESILLTYSRCNAAYLREIMYHELFHATERRLSIVDLEALDNHVDSLAITYSDPDYLDLHTERLARLFETFAMFLDNGGSINQKVWPNDLLYSVYSGKFALEYAALIAAKEKKAARRPLRAALGFLLDD